MSKITNATKSRLTLDLSARLSDALSNYADRQGITKAEALRNAVDLLISADAASAEGLRVGAWGDDDKKRIEREFVGF